jgi:hypothetical protein
MVGMQYKYISTALSRVQIKKYILIVNPFPDRLSRWNTQFISHGTRAPSGPEFIQSFTIPLRHTTLGSTPLDESLARRRHPYLTTHNRQISRYPAGFDPVIPASERPQAHALACAATGIS